VLGEELVEPEVLHVSATERTSETCRLWLWSPAAGLVLALPLGVAVLADALLSVEVLAAADAEPVISTWCPTYCASFDVSPASCQDMLFWSRRT